MSKKINFTHRINKFEKVIPDFIKFSNMVGNFSVTDLLTLIKNIQKFYLQLFYCNIAPTNITSHFVTKMKSIHFLFIIQQSFKITKQIKNIYKEKHQFISKYMRCVSQVTSN